MTMMTRRTFYAALLALFVGGSAGAPLQAQTQDQAAPTAQNEPASDRFGEPVTVRVTNDTWLNMRIYVWEPRTQRVRWRLGTVTALSTATFEVPDQFEAELGELVLVAVAMGTRQQQFTDRLLTWPGAVVDWKISPSLSLSFATVS